MVVNDKGELYQSTSGPVIIDAKAGKEILDLFSKVKFEFRGSENIKGEKWSKLLLNLNNSLNALAGIPIKAELENRSYRKILSKLMLETLMVCDAQGIELSKLTPVSPRLVPLVLTLPDILFKNVARKMVDIDPTAKSSMLVDIERGSITEIDSFE